MDWITINEAIGFLFDAPSALSLKNEGVKLYCDSYYFDNSWEKRYYFHSAVSLYIDYLVWFRIDGWNQWSSYDAACFVVEKKEGGGIIETRGAKRICIYRQNAFDTTCNM